MRRRLTRRIPVATAAVLLAAGLLAGCGGGGDGGTEIASVAESGSGGAGGETQAASDKSDVEQAQEFVDCLRAEGLEVEDPDPVSGELNLQALAGASADADRDKLMNAFQACQDKAPQSLQDQASRAPDTEQQKEFAQCMRDNGVDMADPGPEGFTPESVPTGDPDFDSALEACRDQLGFGGGEDS